MTPVVDAAPNLSAPLLGLFGAEDQYPSPEQTDELARALTAAGKEFEFHVYDNAGHGFFASNRPSYPTRGRQRGLGARSSLPRPDACLEEVRPMCTYETDAITIRGSGKGRDGWMR